MSKREEGFKRSKKRDQVFFDTLATTGNVSRAARESGYKRQRVYEIRSADDAFSDSWDDALAEYESMLEAELMRRAVQGVDKPVIFRGEITNTFKEYSDTLLMFYLKKINPAYRDSSKNDDEAEEDKSPTINLYLNGVESSTT